MKMRKKPIWIVIGDGVYPVRGKTKSRRKHFKTKAAAKAYVEKKKKVIKK